MAIELKVLKAGVANELKNRRLVYLGLLIVVFFLSIRITEYGVNISHSILFIVYNTIKNAILNKDFFLIPICLLIISELILFVFLLFKKWFLFSLISILIVYFLIYFMIKGILEINLYLLTSLPFGILSVFYLILILKRK